MKEIVSDRKLNLPTLVSLASGKTLKILEVSGVEGIVMPEHHSTGEAAIMVQSGEAELNLSGDIHILSQGSSYLLPARKSHSLRIIKDFKAVVVMPVLSDIEFETIH